MPQPSRSRLAVLLAATTAAAALVAGVNACAGDAPTAAPSAPTRPVASLSEAEKAAERAAKEAAKAAKEAEKREFEALVQDYKKYKKAVESGDLRAELLRCEPRKREDETKTIGPKGGKIDVGRHALVIPAGALAQPVTITAVSMPGQVDRIEFEPHGLQFARPVQLRMSYEHCVVPAGWEQGIVYLGNGFKILESRPSFDDKDLRAVSAWLDHFSGYAVATRRPSGAQ